MVGGDGVGSGLKRGQGLQVVSELEASADHGQAQIQGESKSLGERIQASEVFGELVGELLEVQSKQSLHALDAAFLRKNTACLEGLGGA
jgi:hypothetical protein